MTIEERLDALYAELPHLECRGLCADSCGAISMGYHEARRLERLTGEPLRLMATLEESCPYLEAERCTVYDARPLVCRVWGMVDQPDLRCQYGCVPKRWLTHAEALKFIRRSLAISGGKEVTTVRGGVEEAARQYDQSGYGSPPRA
ncbi:MAG: YkgJ family cysteine cluster protein [Dehalococcoidia bacterium]|nr:YkgJ family cysteine cluster protein [Dehalococcoidia bacterium]